MIHIPTMRWWTPGHYRHEPPLMYRFLTAGVLLIGLGFVSAVGAWLWICHEQRATWKQGSRCECQIRESDKKSLENAEQLKDSQDRRRVFQQALRDRTSPLFTMARDGIQKEEEISESLGKTPAEIQSLRNEA